MRTQGLTIAQFLAAAGWPPLPRTRWAFVMGENPLALRSEHIGNELGLKPLVVDMPAHQLTNDEVKKGNTVKTGEQSYDKAQNTIDQLNVQRKAGDQTRPC